MEIWISKTELKKLIELERSDMSIIFEGLDIVIVPFLGNNLVISKTDTTSLSKEYGFKGLVLPIKKLGYLSISSNTPEKPRGKTMSNETILNEITEILLQSETPDEVINMLLEKWDR